MQASDIDLLDRDVFVRGVPHAWFTWLREHEPVFRHAEPFGPGFWVITRYDDVVSVTRNTDVFSSAHDRGGVTGMEDPAPGSSTAGRRPHPHMLVMDPPEHTAYRLIVNRGFTPRMIGRHEDNIRSMAGRIVADAVAKQDVDFVVDVAAELPLQVIAELLGVPHVDREDLVRWSNRIIPNEDPEYAVPADEIAQAYASMFSYAQGLADQRRRQPADDIVTRLLEAEVDGHRLSDMDFNMFFVLLAIAGNETTRNALTHGMNAFLENPQSYRELVEEPSLIGTAIEEILRWSSPVMYFRRNVTQDIEIGGRHLAAGDKVSIWYVSANRDRDHFDDPFAFDIHRSPNDHVALGAGGAHFCLGASLARMEIRVVFEALVQQAPKIAALGRPQYLRSNFIGGIKHLPVRLSA